MKEAVLGKMWANAWEAVPSGAWSTGEPQSTACDKGMGERCWLRIWADCPRTTPQKLPETGFSKMLIVCLFTLSEHYDTIYREAVLLNRVQEITLVWSTGEPRSTACDKGVGERCRLKIWADCPWTAPQKLPRVEHRWAVVDCVWQGDGQALPTENLSRLPKDHSTKTPSRGAQASLGWLRVTRGWAIAARWEFEFFSLSFFF